MNVWDGKTATFLQRVTNIVTLYVLWLIGSLPLVTLPTSTIALYEVIHEWKENGEGEVFVPFIQKYKKGMKAGFQLGLPWMMAGFLLLLDFELFLHSKGLVALFLLAITCITGFFYLFISASLNVLLVREQKANWSLIKKAFKISMLYPSTAFSIIIIGIGWVIVTVYIPVIGFILPVPLFILVHALWERKLKVSAL
jgi:uncharacterized membrane protein YesL